MVESMKCKGCNTTLFSGQNNVTDMNENQFDKEIEIERAFHCAFCNKTYYKTYTYPLNYN